MTFLCATFVPSVCLWWIYPVRTHHKDTKITKDAQSSNQVSIRK